MRSLVSLPILIVLSSAAFAGDETYKLGRDSMRHESVPRGEVTEHVWKSEVFPGTIRRYWVYVPAQYDASKAAAVMVFQDGHAAIGADKFDFGVPRLRGGDGGRFLICVEIIA